MITVSVMKGLKTYPKKFNFFNWVFHIVIFNSHSMNNKYWVSFESINNNQAIGNRKKTRTYYIQFCNSWFVIGTSSTAVRCIIRKGLFFLNQSASTLPMDCRCIWPINVNANSDYWSRWAKSSISMYHLLFNSDVLSKMVRNSAEKIF